MKQICWKFHSFANEITVGADYSESTGKTSNCNVSLMAAMELFHLVVDVDSGAQIGAQPRTSVYHMDISLLL